MYLPAENRYESMRYNRVGRSGLKLPAVSLGLWHNFGGVDTLENARAMLHRAFDLGITHFDLANNYGPPPGSAEENFGRIFARDFKTYRDELIISSKAGYWMWPGPYGEWGSRKYLVSSCDQSLKRMGLDYVDIFYSHRPDPDTPLEETMGALDYIVRSGRALYVGVSNYSAQQTAEAVRVLRSLGTPLLIHQPRYSMLERTPEKGLWNELKAEKVGSIVFMPLAGGLLTGRYLNGIPADSRAAHDPRFLKPGDITPEMVEKLKLLNAVAAERGQTLAQMALSWALRDEVVTSALIGASKPQQVVENVAALSAPKLTGEECSRIDQILATEG